ncbi:MAG TPA: AlpA family transcriptional regulator [Thermoanaerobaculia bacterium]|nr:AlpA family transcriptional regulator [Thermoanaerobaculia bacterium]
MASDLMQHRMVRRPEVEEVTGLSRATLYRLIGEGLFPSPVKLGPNSVGWKESAILEWLDSRESALPGAVSTSKNGERGGAP